MAMDGTPIIVKKVKAHAHAHHGGSWKVAYADFVTAMMAFFMVLWIMGLSDATRTQVAGYFNDPMGYSKTPPLSKNIIKFPNQESPKPGESKAPGSQQATGAVSIGQAMTRIDRKDKKLAKLGKNIEINIDQSGIRIEFVETNDTVFFDLGSAELTPDAKEYVKLLAPTLKKLNMEMTFEGHTDARQYPPGHMDNFTLSGRRADALKNALRDDGIPMNQIAGEMGYGDQELAYPNEPLDPRNRRVTIWVHTAHASDLKKLFDPGIKKSLKEDIKPDSPDISPKAPALDGKDESSKA